MPEENRKSKWIYVRWFAIRFLLVVYDIIAVNAACYLALLTRFCLLYTSDAADD